MRKFRPYSFSCLDAANPLTAFLVFRLCDRNLVKMEYRADFFRRSMLASNVSSALVVAGAVYVQFCGKLQVVQLEGNITPT